MISKPITESGIIGDLVHDGSGKPSRGMILLVAQREVKLGAARKPGNSGRSGLIWATRCSR
jgi:hypothetical protein